ncbi:MAG TPA: alpha/beta fold hydrolase [Myxococcaceae bacterium]|nr:alpha/beta fold hydrolase [Myxococcaceae bacterium]
MAIDSPKSATSQASASHRSAATSSLTPISSGTRFKPDFQTWLKANGYGDYDFAKNPNALPSFGGKSKPGEKLTHQPVILIHGNGDSAAGWNDVVAGYKRAGYKDSEIYAMSWGDGKAASAGNNYHSEHYLREVRGFIQAVKDYTAADKVDVIGHSMGVTLARKAIKGGTGPDQASPGGKYDLGKPITDEVDTFVGISGANEGLQSCDLLGNPNPTSSTLNGFSQHSRFLHDLNEDPTREGDHVYSIYSLADPILGYGPLGGAYTGPIPGQDGGELLYTLGHFQSRDQSVAAQLEMIQDHHAPPAQFENPWIPGNLPSSLSDPWGLAANPEGDATKKK